MTEERRTKSGELWSDLNKRRGRRSAEGRRVFAQLREQMDREERAGYLMEGGVAARINQALGAGLHLHLARTVLTALREPTAGMLQAGRHCVDDANRWRAMIDEALRELNGT
jgi:hypothetical protein